MEGKNDTGIGEQTSLHQQFVKDMSSITQMGILNIDNESMSINRMSPVKNNVNK